MLIRNRRQNGRRLGRLRSSYIGSARERNAVRGATRPAIGRRRSRDRCIDSLPPPLTGGRDRLVGRRLVFRSGPATQCTCVTISPSSPHHLPPPPVRGAVRPSMRGRPRFAFVYYASLLSSVAGARVAVRCTVARTAHAFYVATRPAVGRLPFSSLSVAE